MSSDLFRSDETWPDIMIGQNSRDHGRQTKNTEGSCQADREDYIQGNQEESWGQILGYVLCSVQRWFSTFIIFDILDGLAKVLEITQKILTDGSLKYDFRGKEECRNFVLNENNSQQNDLFGSANIEAWLQLQFSNKVWYFFILIASKGSL